MGKIKYQRRHSSVATIADGQQGLAIGGDNPIRLQSMTATPTMDVAASLAQAIEIIEAGGEMVRLTAQTAAHARAIGELRQQLRQRGYNVPIVADIHFNRGAAFEAAANVDKVRINPGNFADPGRTFQKIEFTDQEYAAELQNIRDTFVPLLDALKEHHTALRIGVNYGSLSDRIMSRYGNTPAGVVESAMEYLRICRDQQFHDVVVSIKSSNTMIMVETVRRMAAAMAAEGMAYPLHLGVTEAGDGDDGRIKSAVGIGTLLAEGLGDTIRVSLSEEPAAEIPVAKAIVDYIAESVTDKYDDNFPAHYDEYAPERIPSYRAGKVGDGQPPVVVGLDVDANQREVFVIEADSASQALWQANIIRRFSNQPLIFKLSYPESFGRDKLAIAAAIDFGRILMAGYQDGIWIDAPWMPQEQLNLLALNILQATRLRISKTEYISCPGCGRTLFDLRQVLHQVKAATDHLKGLKIGVMGCIVNGPGEMADADYGYVGAAAGRVSLYRGKQCVEKNIPADQAVDHLIALIKTHGDWQERPEE